MLGGQGLPLPPAQPLFPNLPQGQAVQLNERIVQLQGGQAFYIPSGWWAIRPELYSHVQYLDPITNIWLQYGTWNKGIPTFVNSDGSSWRVFNPTGCPIGALVTGVGSGYIQSTTSCAASAGGSTWLPIVGGAISTTVTIGSVGGVTGGSNYTLPPILSASMPPLGGVPATAYASISGGSINAITVVDQGAGYTSPPTWQVIPNPFDPNIGIITVPPLTSTLTGAGVITAVVCTYFGTIQTVAPTLTISGAGSGATAVAIMALAITGVSYSSSGGASYPGTGVDIDTIGGVVTNAVGTVVNPAISTGLLIPRKANISSAISGGIIQAATIIDGGLFQVAPTGLVISPLGTSNPGTASAATLTMGAAVDRIHMQNMGSLF